MSAKGTRASRAANRSVLIALLSGLLASCSATSDPDTFLGVGPTTGTTLTQTSDFAGNVVNTTPSAFSFDDDDPSLPQETVSVPAQRGGEQMPATIAVASTEQSQQNMEAGSVEQIIAAADVNDAQPGAVAASGAEGQAVAAAASMPTPERFGEAASAEPQPQQMVAAAPVQAEEPRKRGFLSALFTPQQANASQAQAATERAVKPIVDLNSTAKRPVAPTAPIQTASVRGASLPGVREQSGLFEITRKSGMDDESDIDLHEGAYQVASSAAGLARLAPNGLRTQTGDVDVACIKPSLVRVLKTVEQRYGKPVVVTSGYRSQQRNRQARGARNSLHMYCAAADIQIDGVSKWELAEFLRSMPGRGGVGTYCHTDSVHVDVGPERDWNWRCRRRG